MKSKHAIFKEYCKYLRVQTPNIKWCCFEDSNNTFCYQSGCPFWAELKKGRCIDGRI